jgi:hypothetical protein
MKRKEPDIAAKPHAEETRDGAFVRVMGGQVKRADEQVTEDEKSQAYAERGERSVVQAENPLKEVLKRRRRRLGSRLAHKVQSYRIKAIEPCSI